MPIQIKEMVIQTKMTNEATPCETAEEPTVNATQPLPDWEQLTQFIVDECTMKMELLLKQQFER